MDIAEIVSKFGLPTGLLIYFIWRDYQTSKEHKADLKEIANKAVQAIDKSTDAINESTKQITKDCEVIGENSDIMNTVKGVLLQKGGAQNGTGN